MPQIPSSSEHDKVICFPCSRSNKSTHTRTTLNMVIEIGVLDLHNPGFSYIVVKKIHQQPQEEH